MVERIILLLLLIIICLVNLGEMNSVDLESKDEISNLARDYFRLVFL